MIFSLDKDVEYTQRVLINLIVAFIGVIGLWINLSRYRGTVIAASYLREFIEHDIIGLKWETRLVSFRETHSSLNLMYGYGIIYTVIICINLLLIMYTIYIASMAAYVQIVVVAVVLVNLSFLIRIGLAYKNMPKEVETINNAWREVRRAEKESQRREIADLQKRMGVS